MKIKKAEYIESAKNVNFLQDENIIRMLKGNTVKDSKGNVHIAFDFYSKKSPTRSIKINIGGYDFYVSDPCSKGNSKISKTCLVTKLLPIVTCPNCKACMHNCYALKATILYDYTFYFELFYTYLAMNDPYRYVGLIADQIKKTGLKKVRFHESGDFFSRTYINAVKSLAMEFPEVKFHTFSKVTYELSELSNFNTVHSIIRITDIDENGNEIITEYLNFGDKEYIENLKKVLTDHGIEFKVCPNKVNNHTCMGTCNICSKYPIVLFLEH